MKRVSRAKLRGKPLDPYCKIANTTTNEYGKEDKRVYCYGLYQNNISGTSDDIAECCKQCKAFVGNETPLKEMLKNEHYSN